MADDIPKMIKIFKLQIQEILWILSMMNTKTTRRHISCEAAEKESREEYLKSKQI